MESSDNIRADDVGLVANLAGPVSSNPTSSVSGDASNSRQPWLLYTSKQRWLFLAILFWITTSSYFDYYILSVVLDPIKAEFRVSDTMLGLLSGFTFAILYAIAALPISRWSDYGNRRTVLTLALAGWSVLTAVCGFAQSFLQLAAARFGLGLVEAGAVPPAQSLIADYFPPERRATASAVLTAGSAAGYLIGVSLGGYVAATAGWRAAFLVVGTPGIILAVAVRLILPEPREQLGFPAVGAEAESIRQAILRLRKRSFFWALTAISVYTIFSFGINIFLPSYMIRTLHASLAVVSVTWGLAISVANLIGALVGGWLGDVLSRRDIRWYAWLPALTCALAAPLYWFALAAGRLWSFIVLDFFAELVVGLGISICFATIHAVCGGRRRTMAIALVQLSFMVIGCGLGPLIAGMLSDGLRGQYGDDSLRYSLVVLVAFLLPAAAAFYFSARTIPIDLEE